MTYTCYDAINAANLPGGGDVYLAYLNGFYANYTAVKARFPGKRIIGIAVTSGIHALMIDDEPGDADNAQVAAWFHGDESLYHKPILYTMASNVDALVAQMSAAGFPRDLYRIWSAHYGAGEHICGPNTCGECQTECDATQWASNAAYDTSLLASDFFDAPKPPPPPKPKPAPKPILEDEMPLWDTSAKSSCPVLIPYGTTTVRLLSTATSGAPLKVTWTFIDQGKDAQAVTLDWGVAGVKRISIPSKHDTARLDVASGAGPLVAIQFDA